MPQDYKDASFSNNTGLNGQVTPTVYATPGALTTVTSPQYLGAPLTTAAGGFNVQLTTQVNPFPGTLSSQSVVARQQVAVIGPVYYSDGGILNMVGPANSNLTTGGGP
jgi:hypothetical protein